MSLQPPGIASNNAGQNGALFDEEDSNDSVWRTFKIAARGGNKQKWVKRRIKVKQDNRYLES